jgi:multiple sugar transport system substrate-binding protein
MLKKTLFHVGLVVFIVSLAFISCSREKKTAAGSQTTTPVSIRFATYADDPRWVVVNEQVANFMSKNPDIAVTLERTPGTSYYEKKMAETASRQLPDVWEINPGLGAYWLDKGLLLDITNYIQNDPGINLDEYEQVMVKLFQRGNTQLGIPYDFNGQILYYNKTLLDEAGIPYPDHTWTYETLYQQMTAGKKALAAKGKNVWGLATPIPLTWMGTGLIEAMGAPLIGPDGKIGANEKTVAGLELWVKMMNEGLIPQPEPGNPTNVVAGGNTTFTNNNALFHFYWTGVTAFEQANMNFGAAPAPLGPTGIRGAIIGSGFSVSSSTPNPDQAYRFDSFLGSEQFIVPFTRAGGGIPARLENAMQLTGILRDLAEYLDDGKYTRMNCPSGTGQIWTLKDTLLQEVWIETRSPQSFVNSLIQQGNEALANARDQ